MLTLSQANLIVNAALAKARELNLPPIGCAVLDAGGHLKAFQAEDGLNFARVLVCQAKAWGALGMGVDSEALETRFTSGGPNPGFFDALNAMTGGRIVPLAGGVIIYDDSGRAIGAVGVSGAKPEQDAECARTGIAVIAVA